MAKSTPKKKKVAQKKTASKKAVKKVAKKKVAAKKKSTRQKRVEINKNKGPEFSANAYTFHMKLGEKNFEIKRETIPEIVDALKEEIGSPMNIKTRGDIVIEQGEKKTDMTMFVFPLKRLIFSNGEVAKIVFAKRVALALS